MLIIENIQTDHLHFKIADIRISEEKARTFLHKEDQAIFKVLVRYCHFGVSPVNYSDSEKFMKIKKMVISHFYFKEYDPKNERPF